MLKKCVILIAVASVLAGASVSNVVVTGTATDCFQAGRVQVSDVSVSAFSGDNAALVSLLRSMDTITFAEQDADAMSRFEGKYLELISLADTSAALGRDTTNLTGAFTLDVPPGDSLLIFGYAELEDEPFYYGYKVVGGQVSQAVELDMSLGGCAYVDALDTR